MSLRQYITALKKALDSVDGVKEGTFRGAGWNSITLVRAPEDSSIYVRRGNPMSSSRNTDDYIAQLCFSQTDSRGRFAGVFFDSKFKCRHLDWARSWMKERLQYLLDESESLFLLGYDQTGWTRFERKYDSSRTIEACIEMDGTRFNQRLTYSAHQVLRVVMTEEGRWNPNHYYYDFSFSLSLTDKVLEAEKGYMTTDSIPYMNQYLLDRIVKLQSVANQ